MKAIIRTIVRFLSLATVTKKKKILLVQKCLSQLKFNIYRPLLGVIPCVVTYLSYLRIPITPSNGETHVEASNKLLVEVTQFDVEENIGHLMTLARIALEKGETDKAVAILEMGIKICDEYQSYYIMPYMYDILAAIFFAMGNISRAEELLVQIIEKMLQLGVPENDTQIVDFKLRLARIYSSKDDNALAEIGFRNCLTNQENKIFQGDTSSKTGLLYVNVLFWYGLHKIKGGEYDTAKNMIDSAYTYSQKIKGLSPYQEMIILTTLCDLNMQLEQYEIALQNLYSAILLGKGIGSLELPKCYLKLARIFRQMGSESTAQKWLKEAHDLATVLGDVHVVEECQQLLKDL